MHRSRFDTPRLRATVALSGLSLLAAACGGKDAADLDPVEQQLQALERALPEKRGDRLAGLCLDYASVCERAAGICLTIAESDALEQRCQAINTRCERTLARYCAGRPVRPDAGVVADADLPHDGGSYRDASEVPDSGRRKDAGAPDRGWRKDAWSPPPRQGQRRGTAHLLRLGQPACGRSIHALQRRLDQQWHILPRQHERRRLGANQLHGVETRADVAARSGGGATARRVRLQARGHSTRRDLDGVPI